MTMESPNRPRTRDPPCIALGRCSAVGDKSEQQAIASALEAAGYKTYLPQRDGIEVGRVMQLLDHPLLEGRIADSIMLEVRKWVFALDMYQLLEACQSLGVQPRRPHARRRQRGGDRGGVHGWQADRHLQDHADHDARGCGQPDDRGAVLAWAYIGEVREVPRRSPRRSPHEPYAYSGPPNVASLVSEGHAVWDVLENLRGHPIETWGSARGLAERDRQGAGQASSCGVRQRRDAAKSTPEPGCSCRPMWVFDRALSNGASSATINP